MKLELTIEQNTAGYFSADIDYKTSDGKKHTIVVMPRSNVFCAVIEALDPLLIMAPHLTQEEIDSHHSCSSVGT